jgi:hypothetical protein
MARKLGLFSAVVLAALISTPSMWAQSNSGLHARPRVTESIDESNRVVLEGNTHPEAQPANDRGPVANNFTMDHMLLQLKRSPEQEQALQQFIDELMSKDSPNFHRWLTAEQFGERFGLAKPDLDAVTNWLELQGFRVNVVYPSGMVIDFSGTAAQVRKAFQTEIHYLEVKGKKQVGNMSDPSIPAALAPVVAGVVSLHDFRPHPMHHLRKANTEFTFTDSSGGNNYAVVPADLATIYNLNPLFSAGYSGQGQTIVVIEDTNVFRASDWNTFRSTFGLSSYTSGSFTTVHPAPSGGANNCASPGVIPPNDAEAILDAEWASAAAPNAAIVMATCADSGATFGGLIAIQNLINTSSQPPAIMSISYGQCETVNGAAANAAYSSAYQQAATEGVSVFVAAGDSGAAGCDNSAAEATHGIGVNAFASTPYNVAVGGTDFSDTYSGTNATYWNSSNTPTFGSALSYIPETPWNNSCAGALLSNYEGHSLTYGSTSLCNDPTLGSFLLSTVAGGGGPSACATGTPSPSNSSIVSGTCQGWPKPSWQSVFGNPNDGVRDTPDVSLFAADGLWGHFYVFCWSDTANGGAACTGAPSGWSGAGGTSFASPIMAGIQALVNQKAGGPQGNPNPVYYQLAANEYGSNGTSSCNSSNGNSVASNCIFYDVTLGDMDVDCVGGANCYLADGSVGVLSTSNSLFNPAYGTTTGWDFATGIGSVNAANLVNNWPVTGPNFSLSASPSSVSITQGTSGTSTITITPENSFTGNVTLSASGLPSGVTASFNPGKTTTTSALTLTASRTAAIGTVTVTVTGSSGSLTNQSRITLNVNPTGNYALSASPGSLSIVQGTKGTSTITVSPQSGFNGSVSLSATGLPSGVTASFNPASTTSTSSLTLTASSTAPTGTVTVTITGNSGNLSNTTTVSLTVIAAPNYTLSASPNSLTMMQGGSGTSTITVTPQNGFTGNVSLSATGLPTGVTASFNPASTASTTTLTLTANSTATTGTATVTVTGTSGNLSKTTTISLTVRLFSTLPSVWTDGDIGSTGVTGSASYANGVFTVAGGGTQIYGTADEFHFVYQSLSGDGTVVARVVSLQGGSGYVSAGVMIRNTLDTGSANAKTADWAAFGGIYFDVRTTAGGSTSEPGGVSATLPYWVKVSRSGNTFSSFASTDGVNWVQVGASQTITMGQSVYVGLAVNSGSAAALATATFDNVSVSTTVAPPPNFSLSASPNSLTMTQGTSGTSTITVSPQSGFNGSVSLSASGLPSGVTASFNPVSTASTSSLTLTASSTATTGTVTITVTGTSGNLTNTAPVSLTVRLASTLPPSWTDGDIGSTGVAGSASYANGVFTVNGAGSQIYGTADEFHFVYQSLSGDGTVVARVVSLQGGSGYVSAGVMIRNTLDTGSANAKTADWAAFGGIYFDVRTTAGGSTSEPGGVSATLPYWVKVSRSGNTFSSFASTDGVNWVQVGTSQTITMGQSVYMGLAVNSGSAAALATATFDNVSVSTTVAPPPSFSLSTSPSSVTITQGGNGTSTITVTPQNGFTGNVSLSATGLPSGVTASFNPVSTASTSSLTLTANSTATTGTITITVTGTSGNLTNTAPVSLTVRLAPTLPPFWTDGDIGSTGVTGSASYANGVFTVAGGGTQIYGTADEFHFVYQSLSGDGTVVARVVSLQGGSGYVSAGVMIRNTLDTGSANAKTADWAAFGGIYFDVRTTAGGSTSEPGGVSATLPYWVKVSRSGNTFSSFASTDGVNWVQVGTSQTITMGQSVYVGLAVNSGSAAALATATFDNVSVTSP